MHTSKGILAGFSTDTRTKDKTLVLRVQIQLFEHKVRVSDIVVLSMTILSANEVIGFLVESSMLTTEVT